MTRKSADFNCIIFQIFHFDQSGSSSVRIFRILLQRFNLLAAVSFLKTSERRDDDYARQKNRVCAAARI